MTLHSRLDRWITDKRNLSILVAILVALPIAYGSRAATGVGMASFLLLLTLAVGVPTAFDHHWSSDGGPTDAVGWILVACGLATAVFSLLYVGGVELAGLDPVGAAMVAFLVTDLGGAALLALW